MYRHVFEFFLCTLVATCVLVLPLYAHAASEAVCIEVRKTGVECDASTPESTIDQRLLGVTGGITPTQAENALAVFLCPGFKLGYDPSIDPAQLKESRVYFTAGTATMDPSFAKCTAQFFTEANAAGIYGRVCVAAALRSVDHQRASCLDRANSQACGRKNNCTSFAGCPHVNGIAIDLRQNGGVPTSKLIAFAASKGLKLGFVPNDSWHMEPNGAGCAQSGFTNPTVAGMSSASGGMDPLGGSALSGSGTGGLFGTGSSFLSGIARGVGTAVGMQIVQSLFQPNSNAGISQGVAVSSPLPSPVQSQQSTYLDGTYPIFGQSKLSSDLEALLRSVTTSPTTVIVNGAVVPAPKPTEKTIALSGITEGGVRVVPTTPRPQDVVVQPIAASGMQAFDTAGPRRSSDPGISIQSSSTATSAPQAIVTTREVEDQRLAYATIDQVAERQRNLGSGAFYGDATDDGKSKTLLGRLCVTRPWATGLFSSILNPQPFDNYCIMHGYVKESVE